MNVSNNSVIKAYSYKINILCESRIQAQHGWRVSPLCPLAFEPLIRIFCSISIFHIRPKQNPLALLYMVVKSQILIRQPYTSQEAYMFHPNLTPEYN